MRPLVDDGSVRPIGVVLDGYGPAGLQDLAGERFSPAQARPQVLDQHAVNHGHLQRLAVRAQEVKPTGLHAEQRGGPFHDGLQDRLQARLCVDLERGLIESLHHLGPAGQIVLLAALSSVMSVKTAMVPT